MTIVIPLGWLSRKRPSPEALGRERLQQTLSLARAEARYGRHYPGLSNGAAGLENLPVVPLAEFFRHESRYTTSRSAAPPERLVYPAAAPPRTAVVARRVRSTRGVRGFVRWSHDGITQYRPSALAAPLDALRAAASGNLGLTHGIVVFSDLYTGPLRPEAATELWRRFGVPVFEQLLGFGGELLAWECEAHQGMHIRQEAACFESVAGNGLVASFLDNPRLPLLRLETGLDAEIIDGLCPCGASGPRLTGLRRASSRTAPVLAASPV